MSLRAQTASAVKWTMVASTVVAGSEILRNIVLARFLFPVDFGLMAMVTIVIGLAQMYCDMGMSAAVIYRQDATDDQLSSLYWLNIFSGWTVFAVVWLSTPLITKFYNEPRLPLLLKAVAVVFLITPVCSQFENLLQKELAFDFLAKRDICTSACQTVVAVTFAALGFGVWSLVYGYLINAALRAGLLVHVGFTRYRPRFHFKTSDLKGYLSFGLFQLGERTAFYLSQRSDQVMIGSLLGAQALGYYSFAFNLAAQPLSRINPILTKVAFPAFSRVQDDVVRLRRGYMKLVGILSPGADFEFSDVAAQHQQSDWKRAVRQGPCGPRFLVAYHDPDLQRAGDLPGLPDGTGNQRRPVAINLPGLPRCTTLPFDGPAAAGQMCHGLCAGDFEADCRGLGDGTGGAHIR